MFPAIEARLAWLPTWAQETTLLAGAIALALLLHAAAEWLFQGIARGRSDFVQAFFKRTRSVRRSIVIALFVAGVIAAAQLPDDNRTLLARLLVIAFILIAGWAILIALDLASDFYLRRFKFDVPDNQLVRTHYTQVRILLRVASILVAVITAAVALMTFAAVRQYGVSLLASAGATGIVLGLAARSTVANLIAGVQIAITKPIRIEDAVFVEGEWGWVEDITATYVAVRLWDWRRLILPISYFIETPFQNWTLRGGSIIGSVFLHADYRVPVEEIRAKVIEIAKASKNWDGKVVNLQVTDATEETIQLRALVSAESSPAAWDLRCEVREKLIGWLQQEHPSALPRRRTEIEGLAASSAFEAAKMRKAS